MKPSKELKISSQKSKYKRVSVKEIQRGILVYAVRSDGFIKQSSEGNWVKVKNEKLSHGPNQGH